MRNIVLGLGGGIAMLFAIVAFAVPGYAQAVDPERLALGRTYLEVSSPPVTIQQLGDIIGNNLIQLNPEMKDQIVAIIPTLLPRFDSYMNSMKDDVARVYAAKFTADELKTLIAFYQTPVGQKYAQVQLAANAEADPIARRWGARIGEDMRDALGRELAAQGLTLKTAPAPKQ